MTLNEFLKKINNNKVEADKYINSKKGDEFENRILNVLIEGSEYIRLPIKDFSKIEEYREIKKTLKSYEGNQDFYFPSLKKFSENPRIIYQPFGTQASPDILLIKEGKILPVEVKFTNKNARVPMWNSGLPREGYLYIFGSYGKKDITFFFRPNNLNWEEGKKLRELVDEKKAELVEAGLKITDKFKIYLRPEYQQTTKDIWEIKSRTLQQNEAIELTKDF